MERLDRALVALRRDSGDVYLGWRLLGTDPANVAFHLYRATEGGSPVRLTAEPLRDSTNFVDRGATANQSHVYYVRPVNDLVEGPPSANCPLNKEQGPKGYFSIPLRTPEGYTPNDASVGDLDGDGEYEIVLHQAGRSRDNSQRGQTDPPILEAYRLDGAFLWRICLGKNIREGAHYTQFIVYDFDGDGRAEIACKTADCTVDGTGNVLGDGSKDFRSDSGYVLEGPEYLSVFEGKTGKALATVDYLPPRGRVADWGDDYGNRVDRFLACVAYLDGERPSLVACRGYYTRSTLVAWDWRGGRLKHRWTFDSDDGTPGNEKYRGQGNHNLSVGDVDGDGKDEIVYGACAIDDDGKGLYSTGLGHGDALHLSDIDPNRPGLEVFAIHEKPRHTYAVELRDAATGKPLWGKPSSDVGRGVAFDIDPRYPGYEMWASGPGLRGYWNARGEHVSNVKPRSCNFGVWWDGDLLRELLDGNRISKWNWETASETLLLTDPDCASNNGTKSTPALCADILGDWREEVVWRTRDGRELRIYITTVTTNHRLTTLVHDPQYRLSVAWQNVGYNQPTQPGFYLGVGMGPPPRARIRAAAGGEPDSAR